MSEKIVTMPVERTVKLNRPEEFLGVRMTHVHMRTLLAGDICEIGHPYTYRPNGTRSLDDEKMSQYIAAATGLPLFMVHGLSFADWFNLATIVSEDGGFWERMPDSVVKAGRQAEAEEPEA